MTIQERNTIIKDFYKEYNKIQELIISKTTVAYKEKYTYDSVNYVNGIPKKVQCKGTRSIYEFALYDSKGNKLFSYVANSSFINIRGIIYDKTMHRILLEITENKKRLFK